MVTIFTEFTDSRENNSVNRELWLSLSHITSDTAFYRRQQQQQQRLHRETGD
jgi:hypothetical protein